MSDSDFMNALDGVLTEKNIDKEELLQAIESSIATSYQKNYRNSNDVRVVLDRETGEITVYEAKKVVETVSDPNSEISIEQAKEKSPTLELGDVYQNAITPKDFGRIAAQNAKQMIVQRIKDAERNKVYEEFIDRESDIINGEVTRVERGNVFVDIGGTEALLPPGEQVPTENYQRGQRLKVYLLSVRKTPKGPQIKVSRSHPDLVKRLFEEEVPEIYDGRIEIMGVSREPGYRSKISVFSNDKSIEAVGSCVGQKGIRVQNIIDELGNEKIDVINYSHDYTEYLKNALSPAKIEKILANSTDKNAIVVVDDFQLSLAIGKEGQNVRLAAKLTGWKIDIKSKSAYEKLLEENPNFEAEFTKSDKLEKKLQQELIPDIILEEFENDEPELESVDDIVQEDSEVLKGLFE